jgi:hypothetical protein
VAAARAPTPTKIVSVDTVGIINGKSIQRREQKRRGKKDRRGEGGRVCAGAACRGGRTRVFIQNSGSSDRFVGSPSLLRPLSAGVSDLR